MKLSARYSRISMVTTVIVLFITGVIYYGAISYILNHQVDNDIGIEEVETFNYIAQKGKLPPEVDYKDQQVRFYPWPTAIPRHYTDTGYYNKKEHELESGRALITSARVNGSYYKIVIAQSKVETEDLIKIIFFITLGLILFLLLVLFIANRFVLNRIWQPFYNILQQLRVFNLTDNSEIVQSGSEIDEFQELDKAVAAMAGRVKKDYKDLKTFTENASHELMTPIAVVNSKLDSLIQAGDYNESQSKLLADVYAAISRLTRINQSLLLLVKIENRLLPDEQDVDLKLLVEDKLKQFKELFQDKDLALEVNLTDKKLYVSKYLLEILLNNLLSNAVRHNYEHGSIKVFLDDKTLVVANTGAPDALVNDDIFKRFSKSPASEGMGLGLTITRQICDSYKYRIDYFYQNLYHTFAITFN